MHWLALIIAVLANIVANVALKKAVARTPVDQGIGGFLNLAAEPWMWVGVLFAGLLLGCYLYALKEIELSVAYPAVTGLAMVGIALGGMAFFGEGLSLTKVFAIAMIIAGVVLLKLTP